MTKDVVSNAPPVASEPIAPAPRRAPRSRRTLVGAALAAVVAGSMAGLYRGLSLRDFVFVASAVGGSAVLLGAFTQRARHPVIWRAAATVAYVQFALVVTFHSSYTTNGVIASAASYAIVILGLSFLTGASGQISLGNGAFMGAGAYTVAVWAAHHATTPLAASLALALGVGALIGFLVGLPATRLRGPYLAGMTLAFALAFSPDILVIFSSWTGGDAGLSLPHPVVPPAWLVSLVNAQFSLPASTMWLADISIVTAGITFFFMANLLKSRVGRSMRLVRDNEVAAQLMGISLPRARVIAFVVSAACAGLGGGLSVFINYSVGPTGFELGLSINLLALLIIGGMGSLAGAVFGGLIAAYSTSWIGWFVNNTGLNPQGGFAENLQPIIFGVLLVVAMLVAPLGVVGTAKMAAARWWSARTARQEARASER